MKNNVLAIIAIFLGVLAVSTASILIRFLTVPSIIIAFYRLFLTTLILTPFFLLKETDKKSIRSYSSYYALSGLFLALHFYLWIASLSFTSVSSSVILVSMHPIFVATYAHFVLKEKVPRMTFIGILIAIIGVIILSVGDQTQGSNVLLGDLLAIGGALMMAGYLIIGRKLRQVVTTLNYTFWVYGIASGVLLLLAIVLKVPLYPYSGYEYSLFILLAIVPTLMGHSVFNWALKKVPVFLVSVMILGEPVGATLLAALLLKEIPGFSHYIGGFFVLTGLFLTIRRELTRKEENEVAA